MKYLSIIIAIILSTYGVFGQTDSCKVRVDKLSGTYKGPCIDGLANGKGTAKGEDTYIGSFKDGLPHGKGKYMYKNGDIFKGFWKNGAKDGPGEFKFTINDKAQTLKGYWKNDEYVGERDPELAYEVTCSSGIMDYKIEQKTGESSYGNAITLCIKSAFSDFNPHDLKIEKSSGVIGRSGKKYLITQYFFPFHCEVSYTVMIGEIQKQIRFIFDVYKEGEYLITLSND
jgi:uncharacterized protein YwbE